jgi:hypothetical protein
VSRDQRELAAQLSPRSRARAPISAARTDAA